MSSGMRCPDCGAELVKKRGGGAAARMRLECLNPDCPVIYVQPIRPPGSSWAIVGWRVVRAAEAVA